MKKDGKILEKKMLRERNKFKKKKERSNMQEKIMKGRNKFKKKKRKIRYVEEDDERKK